MDRANLEKHRDQMKQLLAGEIESAQSTPATCTPGPARRGWQGTIELVKVDGEPEHFLLAAKS